MPVSIDPDELPTMATELAHHAKTVRSVGSDIHSCATALRIAPLLGFVSLPQTSPTRRPPHRRSAKQVQPGTC